MFSPQLVAKLYTDGEPPEFITAVDASGRNISDAGSLDSFRQLLRLDLSNNALTAFGGLADSATLKWLSLAHNNIRRLPRLDIPELQVLNVASNQLSGKVHVRGVPKLRALIANDNAITAVKGLAKLPDLNTLVLKNNSITELGDSLRGCTALEKLSMAHNELSDLGHCLEALPLRELRIGHNEISRLPDQLSQNTCLKIVDLCGNPLHTLGHIEVLAKLPLLQQLNVKGCPLADSAAGHPDALVKLFPLVEILDGKRVRPRIWRRLAGNESVSAAAAPPADAAAVPGGSTGKPDSEKAGKAAAGKAAAAPDSAARAAKSEKGSMSAAPATIASTEGLQHDEKQQPAARKKRVRRKDGTSAVAASAAADAAVSDPAASARAARDRAAKPGSAAAARATKPEVAAASDSDSEAEAAAAFGGARSFLEEFGLSGEPGSAAASEAAADTALLPGKKAGKPATGVVAVLGEKSAKTRKAKQAKQGTAGAKAAAGVAVLTGAAVAQLLSSERGLTGTEVGTGTGGSWSAWDAPEAKPEGAAEKEVPATVAAARDATGAKAAALQRKKRNKAVVQEQPGREKKTGRIMDDGAPGAAARPTAPEAAQEHRHKKQKV